MRTVGPNHPLQRTAAVPIPNMRKRPPEDFTIDFLCGAHLLHRGGQGPAGGLRLRFTLRTVREGFRVIFELVHPASGVVCRDAERTEVEILLILVTRVRF